MRGGEPRIEKTSEGLNKGLKRLGSAEKSNKENNRRTTKRTKLEAEEGKKAQVLAETPDGPGRSGKKS